MNEHGWNDPPVFTYSSSQTGTGKRTQLTKRVNHDLSAPSHPPPSTPIASDGSTGPHSAPPPTAKATIPQLPKSTVQDITKETADDTTQRVVCEEVSLETVLQSLDTVMEQHKETIPGRAENEVRSRLAIFSEQWKTGKLSGKVQTDMAKLATALEVGDCILADKIHVALMVDHVSEVSRWMVGVKRLIAILKQQQSN